MSSGNRSEAIRDALRAHLEVKLKAQPRSVHARRVTLGLTILQLGQMADVSPQVVSAIERGRRFSEVSQAKVESALLRAERAEEERRRQAGVG